MKSGSGSGSGSGFSKYDSKEIKRSVYYYKDFDVLINRENIKDANALAQYEADMTMLRQYQLEKEQIVKGRFGSTHLKRIHGYIFQDIYPFAGKLRTENIEKGSTFFCKSQFIEENLNLTLSELAKDKYLIGLDPEEFSLKVAYYMSELNMIHPFREGNGRSIREFIRELAMNCNYIINWSLIKKETLLDETIIAVDKDLQPLKKCILNVIENK